MRLATHGFNGCMHRVLFPLDAPSAATVPIVDPDGNAPRTPPPRHGSLSGPPSRPPAGEPSTGGAGTPFRAEGPPSASPAAAVVAHSTTGNEPGPSAAMTSPVAASALRRRSSRPASLGKGPPSLTVPAPASPPPSALRAEENQPPDRGNVMTSVDAVDGVRAPPPRVAQNQINPPEGRVIHVSPRPAMAGAVASGILEAMPVSVASGVISPSHGAPATAGGGDGSQPRRASQQRENIKPGDAQASPAPLPRGLTGELMRNVAALDVTRMSCDQVRV